MLPQFAPVVTPVVADNSPTEPPRSIPTLAQKAAATRKRRHAKGHYPSPAQKAAYRKLLQRDGRKLLTIAELQDLATHPALSASQREEFAAMAVQACIDGDGVISTQPTSGK